MKVIYRKSTGEIVGMISHAGISGEFGYIDAPGGFSMQDYVLWKYDPNTNSIVKK